MKKYLDKKYSYSPKDENQEIGRLREAIIKDKGGFIQKLLLKLKKLIN